jgi:hypothetical protein
VIPAEVPVVHDPAAGQPAATAGSIIEPVAEVHMTPLIAEEKEPEPENQVELFVEGPAEDELQSMITPDTGIQAEGPLAPALTETENSDPVLNVEEPETQEEQPLTELKELADALPVTLLADAGSPYDEEPAYAKEQLKEWVKEFFSGKSKMVATAFKGVDPRLEGGFIHVVIDTGMGLDHFTEVKREFAGFIREKTGGEIQGLKIDKGEVKGGDKRPYTDKDKLEFLMKKEPKLGDLLKKLDVRQP